MLELVLLTEMLPLAHLARDLTPPPSLLLSSLKRCKLLFCFSSSTWLSHITAFKQSPLLSFSDEAPEMLSDLVLT